MSESRVWQAVEARLANVADEQLRERMRVRLKRLHESHPGASVLDLYMMAGYG